MSYFTARNLSMARNSVVKKEFLCAAVDKVFVATIDIFKMFDPADPTANDWMIVAKFSNNVILSATAKLAIT